MTGIYGGVLSRLDILSEMGLHMKVKSIGIVCILLAVCMLLGCYQPGPGMWPWGDVPGDYGDGITLREAGSGIKQDQILSDALSVIGEKKDIAGIDVDVLSDTAERKGILYAFAIQPRETVSAIIRVTFIGGYSSGSYFINSGVMDFALAYDGVSVSYTASADNLQVSTGTTDSSPSIEVSANGLAGSVSGVTITAGAETPSISVESSVTVEIKLSEGNFSSGSESVSVAEAEGVADGGDGTTESTAYQITTAEQLLNLPSLGKGNGIKTYIEIMNDIEFPADEVIGTISDFVIAGAGDVVTISLSGVAEGSSVYNLFTSVTDSSFSNIRYEMKGLKTFVSQTHGNVSFSDITIAGNIEFNEHNTSGLVFDVVSGTVEFIRCSNEADYTDLGYNHGTSPFVAFAEGGTSLVFDSCSNTGDILSGKWLSVLVGNVNGGQTPASITIRNGFSNTGRLTSFGNIGLCLTGSGSSDYDVILESGSISGFDGELEIKLARTGLSLVADGSQLKFTVDGTLPNVETVDLIGTLHVDFADDINATEPDSWFVQYNITIAEGMRIDAAFDRPVTLDVIGSSKYSGNEEAGSLVDYGNQKYWYAAPLPGTGYSFAGGIDNESGIASFSKFIAIGRDTNGNMVVQMNIDSLPDQE